MSKKKGIPDFNFDFQDEDLQQLFEPFNPPRKESAPDNLNNYPIVLAHGFARPDFLIDSLFTTLNLSIYDFSFVSDRFHYFKGIASHLKKHGFSVFHSRVSWAADVRTRAKDLTAEINRILDETGRDKVHIIAHSMGGLDARAMIVYENMASKIFSLTTIGTPHHGSVLADYVLENGAEKILGLLGNFVNLDGIGSLSTRECYNFNIYSRQYEATNDVIYQAYYSSKNSEEIFVGFQPAEKLIREKQGDNDGLVCVKSQKWQSELIYNKQVKKIRQRRFPIDADHLDQIGWWNLNEFHKAGWWNMAALREKNKNEEIIKNVYLKIAREVVGNKK